ncbi:MAG: peptidoglycan-binding domain-containing protein [Hyphomicrobiaceae bacterium]
MLRFLKLSVLALAITFVTLANAITSANTAFAKECKTEEITAEGEPFISRSLGAYPSSLLAWRKAVREKVGDEYQAWRRAEDRTVQCEQVKLENGKKRWICIRKARPCAGGNVATGGEEKFTFTRPLQRGSKGEDVKALQKLLNDQGYELEVDGNFGRGTRAAVRAYQKEKGLEVDGVAGTATQESLGGIRV